MNTVAGIPFSVFMQFLQTAGIPLVIGTLVSGLTQVFKSSPFIPFISKETPWINRACIVLLALVVQILFDLVSHQPITTAMVHDLVLNYFAATVSYTHVFKPLEPALVSTPVTPS